MATDSPGNIPVYGPGDVTPPDAWRSGAREGFVIELPSGKKARLKRTMNLMTLLEKGKIPNPLAGVVREMIGQRKAEMPVGEDAPETMVQMLELVNSQIPRIFVEPRVEIQPADWDEDEQGEWQPSEGAIALVDIDYSDRMYAFNFAQGQALDLEEFRTQQAAFMASLHHGQGVADNSGQPPALDGPVPGVLPERGGVDVGQPRRGDDESGSGGADERGGEVGSPPTGSEEDADDAIEAGDVIFQDHTSVT